MILVAVGTQKFPFDRLIRAVDGIAEANPSLKFFAQRGTCSYAPRNMEGVQFLTELQFDSYVEKSDLIISHAGVGVISAALRHGKPIIVVPRRASFGEHVDDHQFEIASKITDGKQIWACEDIELLPALITEVMAHAVCNGGPCGQRSPLVDDIDEYIASTLRNKPTKRGRRASMVEDPTKRLSVLMVGVDESTRGGMWSVVAGYMTSDSYRSKVDLTYIPTATEGSSSFLQKSIFAAKGAMRVRRRLREHKPDIVHLHVSEYGSVYRKAILAAMARRQDCRVVVHLHGGSFQRFYSEGTPTDRRMANSLFSDADTVIALGESYRRFLIEIGVPEQKVSIIRNGIAVKEDNPYSLESRDLVFLGGITRAKGIVDLLDAVSMLKEEWPNERKVKLYGPTPELPIDDLIGERGLSSIVSYEGFADEGKRAEVYSAAEFAVLPSHFEVLPMFVIEAMSNGIPTLATGVGMIPEILMDGVNGLLCKEQCPESLARALVALTRMSPKKKEAMSAAAHRTALDELSADRHMADVIALYEAVL